MARPLPFAFAFAAPEEVILLVCMSSPIYLGRIRHVALVGGVGRVNSRLEKLVPALEFLVFGLDNLNTIHNFQQASL
jgi:hypothetical protein